MNTNRYIVKVLQDHVTHFALFIAENIVVMHDNVIPCIARTVTGYLDDVCINRIQSRKSRLESYRSD